MQPCSPAPQPWFSNAYTNSISHAFTFGLSVHSLTHGHSSTDSNSLRYCVVFESGLAVALRVKFSLFFAVG